MTLDEAVRLASDAAEKNNRSYCIRRSYCSGELFVAPQYLDGKEGYCHDAGYKEMGLLIRIVNPE